MKISIEQYERLTRFLDLDMSASEMIAFAEELEQNPDLQEELDFEEEIREGLQTIHSQNRQDLSTSVLTGDELTQFRSSLKEDESREKNEPQEDEQNKMLSINQYSGSNGQQATENVSNQRVLKMQFSFAVAATLLIAVALVYLFNAGSPSGTVIVKNIDTNEVRKKNENIAKTPADTIIKAPSKREINFASLFKTAYKKDTVPQIKPEIYASALNDYNENYYRTIQKIDPANLPEIRGMENDPVSNKRNVATIGRYYTGLSFIETGNLAGAITNLQWVKDSAAEKNYIVKAQWYLALSYLKTGKPDSAKVLLQSVTDNNTLKSYQKKAKELLQKIE